MNVQGIIVVCIILIVVDWDKVNEGMYQITSSGNVVYLPVGIVRLVVPSAQ
jgi:hypothetical protein